MQRKSICMEESGDRVCSGSISLHARCRRSCAANQNCMAPIQALPPERASPTRRNMSFFIIVLILPLADGEI